MTKRLVDIDDELLEAARQAVGESSIKGTVHHALRMSSRNIGAESRPCGIVGHDSATRWRISRTTT